MRLHSSLFKSLGRDRYLDDIIDTLTARRGASRSQREKDWGARRENASGQRKKLRKRCRRLEAFPSLIPLLHPWVSNEPPSQNRQLWAWEGTPTLSARYLLNDNESHPPPPYPRSPPHTAASLFLSVEQKAASVSTSVERGRQTDRFKGESE